MEEIIELSEIKELPELKKKLGRPKRVYKYADATSIRVTRQLRDELNDLRDKIIDERYEFITTDEVVQYLLDRWRESGAK